MDLGQEILRLNAQWGHVLTRVVNRSLSPTQVRDALQQLIEQPAVPDPFISCAEQLKLLRRWNLRFALGISDELFSSVGEPPEWPRGHLQAVVLSFTLNTPNGTAHKSWQVVQDVYGQPLRGNPFVDYDVDDFESNTLRWEIVDLGLSVSEFRGQRLKPATHQVLQAVAYFTRWSENLGGEYPRVLVEGYRLPLEGNGEATVPLLSTSASGKPVVHFVARGASVVDSKIPVVIDPPV